MIAKRQAQSIILFLVCLFFTGSIFSREAQPFVEQPKIEQIKIGNLSLPASQQPGPLIGFGQNMLDKRDLQLFCYIYDFSGYNKNFTTIMPALLYGIKDNFSLLIELPIAENFEIGDQTFSGLQDLLVQLEYAVFDQIKHDSTNQITLVGNVTFPTGLDEGIHQQNFGSASFQAPTFFLGTTISHMDPSWYPFISAGAQITTKSQSGKIGNQFLYQCGLSKNIKSQTDQYIFNIAVELDGYYKQKNVESGVVNPNSGGQQILFGPTCWFSTPHAIFQAGISWVVYQHLFGVQTKNNYLISMNLGYKF